MPTSRVTSSMVATHLDALIVADENDFHARAVEHELVRRTKRVAIVDSADFPSKTLLTFETSQRATQLDLIAGADHWLVDRRTGVWWRRPKRHVVRDSFPHPKLEAFVADEARQAFLGSLSHICTRFINPVGPSRHATTKLFQLRVARDVGLLIPRTLVTNDPQAARSFVEESRAQCIYKLFTGTDFGFFETRLFATETDLEELWRVRNCPMIIQEYVGGELDLRVTVVGRHCFSASIAVGQGRHKVDSRVDRVPVKAFELPSEISAKAVQLVKDLGLVYGALDFRIAGDGQIVFLEINPEGQYLWTEIEAGLEISSALAEALVSDME